MWLPDEYRFLNLFGVVYYIEWEKLEPDCSFFLKTTATAAQVKRALRPHQKAFGYDLRCVARKENGYYGVRVWRIA